MDAIGLSGEGVRRSISCAGAVLLVLLSAACGREADATAPVQDDTDRFTLAPSVEHLVNNGILGVTFAQVLTDERCPQRMLCILPGNASVSVYYRVGKGPTFPVVLNTYDTPRSVRAGGYEVLLDSLSPERIAGGVIVPSSYRAYFTARSVPSANR